MNRITNSLILGPFGLLLLITMTPFTSALTTFGKTSPQNQNPPPPPTPVGKARECRVESDCAAIQNTTCTSDPRDTKTLRCLCGDYTAPVNGLCANKYKAVRAPCNDHEECGEGAQCIQDNNSGPGKRCQCLDGYEEYNLTCNGSTTLISSFSVLLMGLAMIIFRSFPSS